MKTNDLKITVIVRIVLHEFNITEDQIRLKTRKRKIVFPRQIIIYFLEKYMPKEQYTMKELSAGFNKYQKIIDHATFLYSVKTIKGLIETDQKQKELIKKIQTKIEKRFDFIDEELDKIFIKQFLI